MKKSIIILSSVLFLFACKKENIQPLSTDEGTIEYLTETDLEISSKRASNYSYTASDGDTKAKVTVTKGVSTFTPYYFVYQSKRAWAIKYGTSVKITNNNGTTNKTINLINSSKSYGIKVTVSSGTHKVVLN